MKKGHGRGMTAERMGSMLSGLMPDRLLDLTAGAVCAVKAPWMHRAAAGTGLCYAAMLVAPQIGLGAATPAANAASIHVAGSQHTRTVMRRGDRLDAVLLAAGASRDDVRQVMERVGAKIDPDGISAGTPINLVLRNGPVPGLARRIDEVSFRAGPTLSIAILRDGGRLIMNDVSTVIDATPLRLSGVVTGDIYSSLLAAGLDAEGVREYVSAIASHVHPSGIVSGDRFDVVIGQSRNGSGERVLGDVMYAGLYRRGGEMLHMSQWTQGGRLRWFDAGEVGSLVSGVQRPVPGIVSSDFGMRHHPILGYTRMHRGLDFRAGYGTPILAVQTGWVVGAGWVSGYGQQVSLSHGAGLATSYSHMSAMAVRRGDLVHQGQVIGYVGATGLATGPHLHFELRQNGYAVDPAQVSFAMRSQLGGRELVGYRTRLRALLAVPVNGAGVAMTRMPGFG